MPIKKILIDSNSYQKNTVIEIFTISLDKKYIITGHLDNLIKIWDIQTCRCIRILEGHLNSIYTLSVSSDKKYIASSSSDNTIKIWNFQTGKCIKTIEDLNFPINTIIFSLDEKQLITGSKDKSIKIWDISSGSCIKTLKGHNDSVEILELIPSGQRIISGSSDGTIKIWNNKNGNLLSTLKDSDSKISVIKTMDYGELIISNSNKDVKIWNTITGDNIFTLKGHKGTVISFDVSQFGKYLISASDKKEIMIWLLKDYKNIEKFLIKSEINHIEMSTDFKKAPDFIKISFILLDINGNIIEWYFFNKNKLLDYELFSKLDDDDFNLVLSNLIHSRVTIEILANDFLLNKENLIKSIKLLNDNSIIDGYISNNENFLSYLYLQNAISEIINLSGRIEISQMAQSIKIDDEYTLKILKNMISDGVISGFFDKNEFIFIAYEELMTEILYELKKNQIIYLDKIENLFSVNEIVIKDVINELIQRGDIIDIEITSKYIKFKDFKISKGVKSDIEVISEVPEEIIELPQEIKTVEIVEVPQEIKPEKIPVKSKKKKSKIENYLNSIGDSIFKLNKIIEILEIPVFLDETTLFFKEFVEIQKTFQDNFIEDNILIEIQEYKNEIDKFISSDNPMSLLISHKIELKLIEFSKKYLEQIKIKLIGYIKTIKQPELNKELDEAFNNFNNQLIEEKKSYIENILDSIVIFETDSNNHIFSYRFRPTYYEKIMDTMFDSIKNIDGNKIHKEYQIIKYELEDFRIYLKEYKKFQILLITTGNEIPLLLNNFNEFVINSNIKTTLSESDMENIKNLMKLKFDLYA